MSQDYVINIKDPWKY